MMYNIIKSGSGRSLLDGAAADEIIETTTNGEKLSSYGCASTIRQTIRRLLFGSIGTKETKTGETIAIDTSRYPTRYNRCICQFYYTYKKTAAENAVREKRPTETRNRPRG